MGRTVLGEVLFGEAEVDHVDEVFCFAFSHNEVGRLDVPVDVPAFVQTLYRVYHLQLLGSLSSLTSNFRANSGVKSFPFCFFIVARFLPSICITMKLRPLGWLLSMKS